MTEELTAAKDGAESMIDSGRPVSRRFEFQVNGTPLVGNLYSPPDGTEPVARAVLTGPLTSVKEQSSGMYASALARRGYEALAFDHRTFGESGGEPRQFENPFAKVEDIRAAAGALKEHGGNALPMIAVGICAGAGYMARATAEDQRFDGFAGVAGVYGAAAPDAESSPSVIRGRAAEKEWKETGHAETIPTVGPDGGNVAMPLKEAFEYYGTPRGAVPNYTNGYAVQSFAYTGLFDSQEAAPLIKVPAIVIHSENAMLPKLAHNFIERLTSPHEQLWLQSQGQIDFYDDPRLINAASDAIVSFVSKYVR
jgi:fermentation-respiration switch protein FrsA (DUF1100 family)